MAAQLSGVWLNSSAASLTGELLHLRFSRSPLAVVSAVHPSPTIQIVGGRNLGWNGMESSKLSSTLDVDSEKFDWAELERDLYHWTKVLRPVQWYPGHIAKTEKELKVQLKLMDVVIEVRDARIPISTSHPQMDTWLGNRKRIVVLNREDMISKADRDAWASYYARQGTKVVFSNGQFGSGTLKLTRLAKELAVGVNIKRKSRGLLPRPDDQFLGINSSLEPQSVTAQNLITRKAGGRKGVEKEMQIIVDMREFMSSLPNVLHQKGMHIIPVTLEVGDYILSLLICVERKSIQDLFMSFSSGRLYHQVEMMSRYYRIPVLLIEFSQDKSFSFQSANEISDDVAPTSIISKLSLLVLHFPRLRIVWSRSLHATAEIFATLKANQDEPDEAKAIRIGVPSEDGIIEDDISAENFNTSAIEFLRRLPGVTDSNKSLAEVALLPTEELAALMGGHKAAKTLRDFLDA